MCFTTSLQKNASELDKRFQRKLDSELLASYEPNSHIVGFTFPTNPVIANNNPSVIGAYTWGLLPVWAKDQTFRKNLLNAKVETIHELPSFRDAVKNRCLIIADSFYEWKWLDSKGKQKQKYKIGLDKEEIFAMAGIYSLWQDKSTGMFYKSYAMVTTEANELMSEIHNTKKRMPIILTRQNEEDWLAGAPVHEFAKPILSLTAEVIQ